MSFTLPLLCLIYFAIRVLLFCFLDSSETKVVDLPSVRSMGKEKASGMYIWDAHLRRIRGMRCLVLAGKQCMRDDYAVTNDCNGSCHTISRNLGI